MLIRGIFVDQLARNFIASIVVLFARLVAHSYTIMLIARDSPPVFSFHLKLFFGSRFVLQNNRVPRKYTRVLTYFRFKFPILADFLT